MNKTIARRNPYMHVTPHCRLNRKQARHEVLQKWWNKQNSRDGDLFKFWSRQQKKQFLMAGSNAYDKWVARWNKRKVIDPNLEVISGRHVLVPVDVCWSQDRKLRFSLVKANAQGRRRKF